MPTLDWIGKKAVLNRHRQVPYRLLHCDRNLSAGDGPRIVYGEGCRLGPARLKREGSVFRQIPYQTEVS